MRRTTKTPSDPSSMYQDSSESDIDSELERQSHARSRRRGRGGAPKPRIVWHPEMHAEFEAAVEALGGAFHATPKAILEHMGGDGAAASLTLSNVKSHLQKYRLKEQKRREADAEAAGRSSTSLATPSGHSGGRAGGAAHAMHGVPPVAAALRGSPGLNTLSPGMVPMDAIGSGMQPSLALPPLSHRSAHPDTLAAAAASLDLAPFNLAPPPLAIEHSGEEVPFADERLGRQAADWRRKQQVLAAQAAALQQAAGPPSQPQQLALILLQRENLKCLQALHALHLAQMQLHLDTAQRLKDQMGAPDEGWPLVEVKQEQKASEEAIQEVLAAARLGSASPARGEGSAEGSQLGSPSTGADPPAAAMEE